MERTRRTAHACGLTVISIVIVGLLPGCSGQLTDPVPVAVDTSTWSTTTATIPLEVEGTSTSTGLPDDGPGTDRTDPQAVARAFVMVVANRRRGEPLESWKGRAAPWATSAVVDGLDDRSRANELGSDLDARNGEPVSDVVGTAMGPCDAAGCHVLVVANESLLVDGRLVDEQSFVTWQLVVIEDGAHWWKVDAVGFGAGS